MNTQKFNGQRFKDALQFREKRMSDITEETGISKQSLSLYANGLNIPSFENVKKIADALKFPTEFFMNEDHCTVTTGNTYFRSQASATKKSRNAQIIKLEFVAKAYEVLLNYINFPELNLPDIDDFSLPDSVWDADSEQACAEIEKLAMRVRQYWEIEDGPIDNLQFILESNGIIVTGFEDVASNIDAFSQQITIDGKRVFIVALALGDKPIERLRFDMAHELGHILMHSWIDNGEELSKEEFNAREKQANIFASAFLLPKESFVRSVSAYPTKVEYYMALKRKWKVSMQAMMYRARSLNVISANQFQYMMRIMSKNGCRIHEPGDVPGKIGDTIFQSAIDLLFDGGYLTADSLLREFAYYGVLMSQSDLEKLLLLKEGSLQRESNIVPFISIKENKE